MVIPYNIQLFYALRKVGIKLTNQESHVNFLTKCRNENIISNGFLKHHNITYEDQDLKTLCYQTENEGSWKIQAKVLNFLQDERKMICKELKSLKGRLFQCNEIMAVKLFMKIKNEMNKLKAKFNTTKERKWNNLKEKGTRFYKMDNSLQTNQQHQIIQTVLQKKHRRQRKRKVNAKKRN